MANAFLITGQNAGYDWTNLTVEYNPTNTSRDKHPSCVELNDGRILIVYSRSSTVYQAYVSDIDTFLSGSGTATFETTIITGIGSPRATVFWGDDSSLNLIIATNGIDNTIPASVKLYKSTLKDGTDWTEFSTINSLLWWDGASVGSGYIGVGLPIFFNSMWIVSCPYFFPYSAGYCFASGGIYTSSDQGATWTKRYGITDTYGEYVCRNIGVLNGELWCTTYREGGSVYTQFIKSSDGITWSNAFTVSNSNCYVFDDNDKLYSVNVSRNILCTENSPTTYTDFSDSGYDLVGFDGYFMVLNIRKKAILVRGTSSFLVSSSNILVSKRRIRRFDIV